MKKPPLTNARTVIVVGVPGGGPLRDGTAIVIELELLDGNVLPFQFSPDTADKLVSATQRFMHEAEGITGKRQMPSAAGAIEITAAMMSFQAAVDGSHGLIVIRPQSGPPLSIRIEPEDFQPLRDQIANTERLMSEARKSKGN